MAQHSMSLPSYPKCIRKEDFELIQSFDSIELYQSDYYYGSLLPALSKEQFLTIQSFDSYVDFQAYLFDTNERNWTSINPSVSCTWDQFCKDWDSGISELSEVGDTDYPYDEGEENSCYMLSYDYLPYTKGREVRANRRKNDWLFQKKAFRTEEILKARELKEDRELQKKAKTIQKALLRSKQVTSKEDAKAKAESMVCLKPNTRFTRVFFTWVSYAECDEIKICPYKKRAAKTFHEKHRAMKKCAAYREKLLEIRALTLQVPGHDRTEAKRAYNIKHFYVPSKKPEPSENNTEIIIHSAYHNAIIRVVGEKKQFLITLNVTNKTPVQIVFSQSAITGKILSLLCTINN